MLQWGWEAGRQGTRSLHLLLLAQQYTRHLSFLNTRKQFHLLPPASGCFSHGSCKHNSGPVRTVFSGVLDGACLGTDYADLGANAAVGRVASWLRILASMG